MKKTITLASGQLLSISHPEPEDAAEILDYLKVVGGETDFLSFGSEGLPFTVEQEASLIRSCQSGEGGLILKATLEGKLVASLTLTPSPRPRLRHCAEFGISVLTAYHRLGIGRALMIEMMEWARANGIRKIDLRVNQDNQRAIEMYHRFGFKVEGKRSRAIKIKGEFKEEWLMGMPID